MRVSVELDERRLKEVQLRLGQFSKKAPNAISNALNRAMNNVNTNIKKEIRKEYHIKVGDINATLTKMRASKGSLSAAVKSKGHLIGLDKFKISPKTINPKRKSLVSIAVKKSGGKKVKGAFVADANGAKMFMRLNKDRLPIRRLFGPSVPQMLGNQEIRDYVEAEGKETFERRLDHEINRLLDAGRS
ncbi:MAG TPA: phage tail protein [Sporosarcina psychrophila]|uniref:Phage tail protein n=1 Tax=Sporosarcina psychrophila TaxID=1476 RepID=A0A921G3E3_SPOPS|nr:phage tail protein [Sporosarcina psychrophila]